MKKKNNSELDKTFAMTVAILLFFSGVITFYKFAPQQETMMVSVSPSPFAQPDGWMMMENMGHKFFYPAESKAEKRENESLVTFIGPTQVASGRTQTELFDGYSFRAEKVVMQSGETMQMLAQNERDNAERGCENPDGSVSQLKEVSFGGATGYQYSVKGCYIDYTSTLIGTKSSVYRVSQSYVGTPADQETYQRITDQMLKSLSFAD